MKNNDAKIKNLMKVVEDKKKELGNKKKIAYSTNGVFRYDDSNYINLNVQNAVDPIIKALAFLITQQDGYAKACAILGTEDQISEFSWDGYTLAEWKDDFRQKVDQIKWNIEKKKFDTLKKKLDALVSEEARTEMELEDIEGLLR